MMRFFLECTIRAALIVGATAIVLYAMRVKVASVKHRVWTAVLLLMLALPLWIAWGPKAPIRILPANVGNFTADLLVQTPPANAVQPQKAGTSQATPTAAQPLLSPLEWSFLGLYLFGALILFARLAIGTLKASRLIRDASAMDDLRISASCAAPVTVGCFRPAILLPENWREWSASQLAAVLAHEREHARRRDPLIQWLALFNRAVFWFHPAAWWLERELSALAEESCDAAVLAQGHDPEAYAETLMHMARAVMHSGARIEIAGNAMPGPRLPQRIRKIIEARLSARISRARGALLVGACVAICAAFVVVTLSRAQTPEAGGGKMSFEVASVRQNKSETPSRATASSNFPLGPGGSYQPNGGLFRAVNFPISTYIGFAFGLTAYQRYALDAQLPKWAKEERFDIQARAGTNSTKDQMRMMMRTLLADRFKLVAHTETHQGPVFALVLAKPGEVGPQLHLRSSTSSPCAAFTLSASARSADGSPTACDVFLSLVDTGHIKTSARNVTLRMIAGAMPLPGMPALDRPVVDETGLAGNYDFTIDCAPESTTAPETKSAEPGPTFLEALQDQLGLKLVSKTGEVTTLVIDHIEEPTPN